MASPEIQGYFRERGVPREYLPFIQFGETYSGSWILDAAVVMAGTVGTAYTVLKGVSELPELADGLVDLKNRIVQKLKPRINREASEKIYAITQDSVRQEIRHIPPPPATPIAIDLVIDARPMRSLTPAILKAHKIHLSVAVSRDSFVLENLGEELLRDVQIGIFRTKTERNQWAYNDSYMGSFPLVSSRQTITKAIGEFRDRNDNRLDFSDGEEAYVDCWVSDSHGIYLFRFFLERE